MWDHHRSGISCLWIWRQSTVAQNWSFVLTHNTRVLLYGMIFFFLFWFVSLTVISSFDISKLQPKSVVSSCLWYENVSLSMVLICPPYYALSNSQSGFIRRFSRESYYLSPTQWKAFCILCVSVFMRCHLIMPFCSLSRKESAVHSTGGKIRSLRLSFIYAVVWF